MREDLPEFDAAAYDRPNQPWVCGRSAEGDPCAFGPGKRGVCPALAECKPVQLDGQWKCERSELRGGPCESGPTADGKCCRTQRCRPVRNLRSLRGVVVRSVAVMALGVVLMMLGSSYRNTWLAPGPLAANHAQVLSGASWDNRCESCHAAAERPVGTWLAAVAGGTLGPTQSSKCMVCHEKTIEPSLSLAAHNLPSSGLAALHPAGTPDVGREPACSVCHQEHHGANHNLAAMDDARCQTCHAQQFRSFASDHPDFTMWPYRRRTRIAFNHATHSGKYFAEKGQEFTCQQCHVEDASRNVQLTLGYDHACAGCHDDGIVSTTAAGVAALAMPMLDTDTLAEAGHPMAGWPTRATGDFDGQLPPVMKLLLASDAEASRGMATLGYDFDFFDVDPDDPEQLDAAAQVAGGIVRLLEQLSAAERVDSPLLAGLTPEMLRATVAMWSRSAAAGEQTAGGWTLDSAGMALRYRPRGHADTVLTQWLESVVAVDDAELREALLAEFAGPGGAGQCTTCHSIEEARGDSGALRIQWRAYDARQAPRSFTKFSHGPHLLPLELRDCTACHTMDTTASTAGGYVGHNAAAFASEFKPIGKGTCATCHNKAAVGDSCTDCHNYHVDRNGL